MRGESGPAGHGARGRGRGGAGEGSAAQRGLQPAALEGVEPPAAGWAGPWECSFLNNSQIRPP